MSARPFKSQSIEDARGDYVASRFDDCVHRLARVERQLQGTLLPPEEGDLDADLALLRQLNQWLGLCLVALDRAEAARQAFTRTRGLPGDPPDHAVFSPVALRL